MKILKLYFFADISSLGILWTKLCTYAAQPANHTGLNVSTLSRTPLAQFSRKTKHHIRSCGFTTSYLFEMFFTTREKCCYMLIFANECAVLIESFEKRFEATPFFIILCRWRKFLLFIYFICYDFPHRSGPTIPLPLSHF